MPSLLASLATGGGQVSSIVMVLGFLENRFDGTQIKEKHMYLLNYAF